MHRPLAHIIYQNDGNIHRITTDDDEVSMASMEGQDVSINVTTAEILEELAPLPPHHLMTDATWRTIAPHLQAALSPAFHGRNVVMPVTLPDLPVSILSDRLNTLTRIFDPAYDLPAYLKLSELDMAYQHRREPSPSLFNSPKKLSWESIYTVDVARLDTSVQMEQQAAYEKATDPNASRRSQELVDLNLRELEYALETHPDNQDSPGLKAG